ncbi:NCBP, partial [Symbiodinium pilosum]
FNAALIPPDDLADLHEEDQDPAVPEVLPLRYTWVVWQQLASSGKSVPYEQSTKQIASVATVEEFWHVFDRLPQPSDLLTRRMAEKAVEDGSHIVDALMIFREGVLPQWEDAANSEGGHLQFHFKASVSGSQLDEYWNNLVLGALGNTLEPPDMITGLRLVDKVTTGKGGVPSMLRMEVWFGNSSDVQAVTALQRNVERCVATRTLEGRIGALPKADLKHHKMTRHQ